MATKTIAWTTGSGNITLTYTGQGNGSISVSSSENDSFDERSQNINIVTTNGTPEQAVSILVKQKGKSYPVGEVFNFAYTGSVQQITLPKGKYKLQCWGAQGGNVTGTYAVSGSKGGYSEGVLTLTKTTTLYIFVGGQGTSYTSSAGQTSTSVVNGGWNGGGAGRRTSLYNSGGIDGRSFPRGGGGGTDIALVTSAMSYSSGRTTRDSTSLLSRIIVAGGGAGASARYTVETTTILPSANKFNKNNIDSIDGLTFSTTSPYPFKSGFPRSITLIMPFVSSKGRAVTAKVFTPYANLGLETIYCVESASRPEVGGNALSYGYNNLANRNGGYNNALQGTNSVISVVITFTSEANKSNYLNTVLNELMVYEGSGIVWPSAYEEYREGSTSTATSSGKSNTTMQGGGTSGKGQYPGKATSAGSGGAFGLGGSQSSTNIRYCSGGGGGGWYGGGRGQSDTSTSYINYTGGGSGFVNTSANASSRPSGYTGLQLDSGTTKDGSTSFESVSGGTETGHSGNGYARITVIE